MKRAIKHIAKSSINWISSNQKYQNLFNYDQTIPKSSVYILGPKNRRQAVSIHNILPTINNGDIILVKQGLKHFNFFSELDKLINDSIREILGPKAYNFVQANGIEEIHKWPNIEDCLVDLIRSGRKSIVWWQTYLMSSVVYHLFNSKSIKGFYSEMEPNFRVHVPYEYLKDGVARKIESMVGTGQATVHGPHKDSWYLHPFNTINIWAAVGDISEDNGLFIMPRSNHLSPRVLGNQISKDQYYNIDEAVKTNMKAGDFIIFSSELIHGSIINQSSKTRSVVSMRLTLEKPKYYRGYSYDYRYVTFDQNKITPPKVSVFSKDYALNQWTKNDIPEGVGLEQFTPPEISEDDLSNKNMVENKIYVINSKFCAFLQSGEIFKFPRRCPHQGADLSYGTIENGEIICPWHLLKFNVNGISKCKSLKLKMIKHINPNDNQS